MVPSVLGLEMEVDEKLFPLRGTTAASQKISLKTSFRPAKVVEPIYKGGKVSQAKDGTLATPLGDTVLITRSPQLSEPLRIQGDSAEICNLFLVPSGAFLIACSLSMQMRIYSLPSANQIHVIKPHETPVSAIETDNTSTLVATGGAEGFVKVWDIEGGHNTHIFKGHGGLVSVLKFWGGKESRWRLASGSEDCKIRIWDLVRKSCLAVLENHFSVVRGLDFSIDGETMVSAGRDQVVNFWDMKTFKLKSSLPVYEELEAVGYLTGSEGQYFYTGGQRGVVRIWDTTTKKEIAQSPGSYTEGKETGGILDIIYNRHKKTLLTVLGDQTLLFYNVEKSTLSLQERLFGQHDEILDCTFVGPSDLHLAIAPNESEIRLLDIRTSACEVLPGHRDTVLCLDKDASGEWLVSGAKDHEARLWKLDFSDNSHPTFSCFALLKGHTSAVSAVALPRNVVETPAFMITASDDRFVKCWDLATGRSTTPFTPRSLYTQKAHEKDINAIDVSSDDRLFATASQDRTIKLFNVKDGQVIATLKGHKRSVFSVKFSPKEGVLASGSFDNTIKIWSLANFDCLMTFQGHEQHIYKVLFMSAGKQVVSADNDGLVKIWTIKSGECETTLDNHSERVWSIALNSAENVLVSGGGDGVITFWEDTTALLKEEQRQALEERVEKEQDLANYIQRKDWRNAILTAMSLDHPYRLLNLFKEVISNASDEKESSILGLSEVDEIIATLSMPQLSLLLSRVRDWSTNARTSLVAQRILHIILKKYPPEQLLALPDIQKLVDALIPYSDRYLKQVDKLLQDSYVVDYILREMEDLDAKSA